MKKEIVISDIDFLKPNEDNKYSDNIIRNLLGNYYLATNDKKYLWVNNVDTEPKNQNKLSLLSSEQDVLISSNQSNEKEIINLSFSLPEWNTKNIDQATINLLQANINNLLASSYFYGISKTQNPLPPITLNEEKLIKSFGKYFYDYSLILPTPVVTNLVGQKNINESISLTSTAKILPIYNYYDKNYEEVAKNNKEATLFNYYSLYYYLLENLGEKKEAFLNKNVLPSLKKYKDFLYQYLQSDKSKEKLIEKIEEFQGSSDSAKNIIAIFPDALKLFNELDNKKAEQPFGIDVSFAPQPIKTIGTLLSNTSHVSDITKFVVNKDLNKTINNDAYIAEIFFNNSNQQFAEEQKEIPIINLNNWLEDVTPSSKSIENEQTIVFTKNEKDKESIFLQKIKKVLLQKKVDELIKVRKRTFTDIISGVPAYSEVLLYEINKYSSSQLLQTILIPNTEELDFYKYFDTQIKYDTVYTYDIKAWTLIVGNKYKYFDRVEFPPPKKIYKSLKNSTFDDSEYFRWFRIMHLMTTLSYFNDGPYNFFLTNQGISSNVNVFGGSTDLQGLKINLSRTLFESYTNDTYVNQTYKNILQESDIKKSANSLISKVKNNFVNLLMNLLMPNKQNFADTSTGIVQYQTFKPTTISGISTDIRGDQNKVDQTTNYYSKSFDILIENTIVYEILQLFVNANIFEQIDYKYVQDKIVSIKAAQKTNKVKLQKSLETYLQNKFIVDINKFLDGGFSSQSFPIDLTSPDNINYGLDKNSNYYPRFYVNKNNNNKLNGHLQFGVYNESDIILAGLPYINKTSVKVISSPPPPPEITIIPYKNVKNKIKFFISDSFFTYRDYPIYMSESDTAQYDSLKENEKIKYSDDGKITFSGDEPSALFGIYRLEEKPRLYKDFNNAVVRVLQPKGGGFEDEISPNKKYYYTFRAVDNHSMVSNPTAIYEIEIVENSGAIYPIINIVELYEEDNRTKIISFKDKFKINVNKEHILEKETITNALQVNELDKFGSIKPSIFGKNFKIRITSKTTKKKIDINLSFTKEADLKLVQAQIEKIKKDIQNKTKKVKS